jgi:branched-chain amino acid transport system ATP-binding protein
MNALIEVEGLRSGYGDFEAIHGIDLTVSEGEVMAIIGANGAGKSTLLRSIAGLCRPMQGTLRFDGADLASVPAHRRPAAGIALVPEGRRLFRNLTVEENLRVAGRVRRPGPWRLQSVYELFPLVAERRRRIASQLSGGEQQAVAIGRALMTNPRLLLLDEVSLGLAPVVVKDLYTAIPSIIAADCTIVLVEQDIRRALTVADSVQCLLEGRTSLAGRVGQISPESIAEAYFGTTRTSSTTPVGGIA